MNSLPAHSYELRQVTRHFGGPIKRALTGGTPALDGATATLPGGRVYGLIGRNGAGKTTLLRAMAGQVRVKGELLVDGQPVWDNPEVLDRIILAGPDVPWPTEVKVKKLLSVAAVRWATWDQAYADALIADYQLDTSKKLSELSRGQRSLVSVVLGLAAQCPITLLDEPYLGLDVQNREQFYRHLMEDVQRNPRTIVLSTHHIDDASRILDSVILLDQGRITGLGELEDFTERVAVLSGSVAAVDAQLGRLGCGPSSLLSDATSAGLRRVTLDLAVAASGSPVSAGYLRSMLEGTGVRMHLADLEQAVLALTGRDIHSSQAQVGEASLNDANFSEVTGND
ncbi:ABC transporter ATP-binding protein [uncultured Corynebacterium sp.]|uniref:ATP-binding cassette domain-containing protein n=1 Tax=uncultured Corynebacterium sp. TaxID=159447 RepID=UPI00259270CE|nr:ABC transporter ATP-binding protein [uncultured Corynebacterium sp.]